MKHTITFTVGLVIFAAAGAIGKSDQPNTRNEIVTMGSSEFGQVLVENLTAEQRALLQSRFRYWTSTSAVVPKAPI